jgi:alkyl hydroperoxide reductase subunit AhpC
MNLKNKSHGNIAIRDIAPDFKAETSMGTIKFHEWLGDSWGVFFHPADFTPVCTTELGTVANYYPEFVKRNAKK